MGGKKEPMSGRNDDLMADTSKGTPMSSGPGAKVRRRHHIGYWLTAFAFTTVMAFSTVPTPLYAIYRSEQHFGSFILTVVFAVYAIGVLIALLLGGHVSDWLGRRTVLLPAIGLSVISALIFLSWTAVPALLAARLLSGLSVGLLTATATAYLADLRDRSHPGTSGRHAAIVATAANMGGLGLGPFISGLLAQYVPEPLHTPYLVFAALLLLAIVAIAIAPETVTRSGRRPSYRPQWITFPGSDVSSFRQAALGSLVAFAVFGLFTSLAPTVLTKLLGSQSPVIAGAAVLLVFGLAALIQTVVNFRNPLLGLRVGLWIIASASLLLGAGVLTGAIGAFLCGGGIAGAGAGLTFKSAMRITSHLAGSEYRAQAMAALFFAAYIGLVVPILGLGVALEYVSLHTGVLAFVAALAATNATVALMPTGATEGKIDS